MSLIAVAVIPGLLAVVAPALLVGLILWLVSRGTSDDGGVPARAARRHELAVTLAAVIAAALTAGVLALQAARLINDPKTGLVYALAPFAVAAVFALVRTIGELTWPQPTGTVRSAPLERRTVRSLGGPRLHGAIVTAGVLVVGLVATGLTADASGRAFWSRTVLADGTVTTSTSGPYPGWTCGIPMLLGLGVVAATTYLALRTITRRPPLAGVPAAHDDAVRRTSADRLLAGVQLCIGVALGGTLWMAGHALAMNGRSVELNGAMVGSSLLVTVGTVLMVAAVAAVVTSGVVAVLAVWSRRVPRPAAPTAQGTVA